MSRSIAHGSSLIGIEVRRAPCGPGLWPGPRCQARWAGRGLRRSRVGPEDRFCGAVRNDLRVPLTLEGPARTMRGVPPHRCDIFTAPGAFGANASAWSWCWRARQRDTAGTAGGRSPGMPRAAARRAVGLASEGRGESYRPATARPLGGPWPPTAGHPGRSFLSTARARPRCSRPGPSGPARRRRALDDREENPHSIDIATLRHCDIAAVGSSGAGLAMATRGSRIAPRWFGWSGRRRCPIRRRRNERCPGRGAGSGRSSPGSRGRHCLGLRSVRTGLG
jgi:hypothetical protein